MTREQAIKKLKKFNPEYNLQIDAASSGSPNTQGAKIVIQLLDTKEDKTVFVKRYISAYGTGATLQEAQDSAIVTAVQGLGL